MSHSLNSLKGGYIRNCIGTTVRDVLGDTRSLDYSSYSQGEDPPQLCPLQQHPLQPSRCAPGGCEALLLSGFRGPVLGGRLCWDIRGGHAGIIMGKR